MPAKSLYLLARSRCIKYIKFITDVGDVPYERVRSVLTKVENPEQLRQLELASPQICGEDAEIWQELIKRDIPRWWKKQQEPKNPKNWHKLYHKLLREKEADVARDAEVLKAAMDKLSNEKAQNKSHLVDPSELPGIRKATALGRVNPRTSNRSTLPGNSSVLSFGSGSRTRTNTGRSVMDKAKREAREMSLFSVRKSILSTPTHRLNDKASQVRTAPRGLVDEHRRPTMPSAADADTAAKPVYPPRRATAAVTSGGVPSSNVTMTERERRLKALTAPSNPSAAVAGVKRDRAGHPTSSSSTAATPTHLSSARTSTGQPHPNDKTTHVRSSNAESSAPARPPGSPPTKYKLPKLQATVSPPGSRSSTPVPERKAKEVDIFLRKPTKRRRVA
ncbi:MAG: hypothetical protein M1833_002153 [Piccolia ochrophora]|nr:MAG: hypothetical protein M1833_002153 [Piccolia ochrophora]